MPNLTQVFKLIYDIYIIFIFKHIYLVFLFLFLIDYECLRDIFVSDRVGFHMNEYSFTYILSFFILFLFDFILFIYSCVVFHNVYIVVILGIVL